MWLASVPTGRSIPLFARIIGWALICSSSPGVKHAHTQSFLPLYVRSFLSALSLCMWQSVWELIQFMKPPFSPPFLVILGKSEILEVLNQIWITVGGQERERARERGWIQIKPEPNFPSSFRLLLLWEAPIQTCVSSSSTNTVKRGKWAAAVQARVCSSQNQWICSGSISMNQRPGLWSLHSLEVLMHVWKSPLFHRPALDGTDLMLLTPYCTN